MAQDSVFLLRQPYRVIKSRKYPGFYSIEVSKGRTISLNGLTNHYTKSELRELFGVEV